MKFATTALTGLLWLTACSATTASSPPSATLVLPDVASYSAAEQDAAAAEIVAGACPVLSGVFMPDYMVMRRQTRCSASLLSSEQDASCPSPQAIKPESWMFRLWIWQ